jgi:hypothetical protein
MNRNTYCDICENEIVHQSTAYSLISSKEHFVDDAYTVEDSTGHLISCWDCYIKYSICSNVNSNLYKRLSLIKTDIHDDNVQVMCSHYECYQCSMKIADGSNIFTVSHSIEKWINQSSVQPIDGKLELFVSSVEPIDVTLELVLCSNCCEEVKLTDLLKGVVNNLLSNLKRKRMKLV